MHAKKLLGLAIFCFLTTARADLTNGLVAYYPFSGSANDASGNGQHGIVNGATLTADRFGHAASAYSFDGINDYISAVITNLPSGSAARTMTAWIMPNKRSDYAMLGIIGYGAGTYHTLFGLAFGNGERFSFWGGYADFDTQERVPLGSWSFVAITYSNQIVEMAVNGIVFRSGAIALDTRDNGKFFFGAPSIDGSGPSWPAGTWERYFTGSIDDVRLYNRALTTSEVQQLYEYESGPRIHFVKAFTIDYSNLFIGSNYQLQASTDLSTWTNYGAPFTATSVLYTNTDYQRIEGWGKLFFRLQSVP